MIADGTSLAEIGRSFWAKRIGAAWGAMLGSVIATGQALAEAKKQLAHGEFEAMIGSDLPFSTSTARMLMKIAHNPQLTNREYVHVLPTSWGTLYELSKLEPATLTAAITEGRIRPDMERKEAVVLRTGDRRVQRLATAERLSQAAPPIASVSATRRYPVVYADPPWKHTTWSEAGKEKSQENHYPTLSQDELKALPISALAAQSAALFLWSTGPQLAAAIALIEAWGFTYKSHVVWRKTNEDGTPHRGTGYWFISVHELLLVATRGDIPAPLMGTQELSEISAPVGRHSEKPARFHELIERYFPDVGRIELFARARRDGWDAWGNEVGNAG